MATGSKLVIPYKWKPRQYQLPFWNYMNNGPIDSGKRAILCWHRRAGKDLTALNWTVVSMLRRPGLYWHLFPTYKQARKAIWNGFTSDGRRFIDCFPPELVKKKRDDEMRIELINGAIWQCVGTDDVDNLVGSNPVGQTFSEFPLQNVRAWELLSPILAENRGWANFIYTPRGRNHGYDLYNAAKKLPGWFVQKLTVDDTWKHQGGFKVPLVTPEAIDEERALGTAEEVIQQEFYCSFEASLVGAYFKDQMAAAEKERRFLGRMPVEAMLPVHTAWDLGLDDAMAIWFFQLYGNEIRVIDYLQMTNTPLGKMIKLVKDKSYNYGEHLGPHDIKVRSLETGLSRIEFAKSHGIKFTAVAKPNKKVEAIQAVRGILPQCYFLWGKCYEGIECLKQYSKKYDKNKKIYLDKPDHNDFSHGADAMQTLALGLKHLRGKISARRTKHVRTTHVDYDPHDDPTQSFSTIPKNYDVYKEP